MAKRKKSGGMKRARSSGPRKHLTYVTFGGKKKDCYGKTVRTGRGNKRAARVYCANAE